MTRDEIIAWLEASPEARGTEGAPGPKLQAAALLAADAKAIEAAREALEGSRRTFEAIGGPSAAIVKDIKRVLALLGAREKHDAV